jgi:hypothetical protein
VSSTDSTAAPATAKEVLAYFLRNPQTADNLEGIARWRLQQQRVDLTVEQVDRALGWLVEQELLVRESRTGLAPIYRLNRQNITEAERLLAGKPDAARRAAAVGPGALLAHALAWIDATLLRHHRRHPPTATDLPGLARSAGSVESALVPRVVTPASAAERMPDATESATRELMAALEQADPTEPLAALYRNLGLSAVELQAVLLCLAPELDAKYQTVFGILNDDLTRRTVTLGLLCALVGEPLAVRNALARTGGLARWRLLEHGTAMPFADEPLRLDPVVVAWLLGDADSLLADARLGRVIQPQPWPGGSWMRASQDVEAAEGLEQLLALERDGHAWVVLAGADAPGWRALLETAAHHADLPLVRVRLGALAGAEPEVVSDVAARLVRAVKQTGAVPVLDADDAKEGPRAQDAVAGVVAAFDAAEVRGVLIASDAHRLIGALPRERCRVLERDRRDTISLAATFAAAASDAGIPLAIDDAERLAQAFPLSPGAIDEALRLAAVRGAGDEPPARRLAAVSAACRRIASPELPRFARRMEPIFGLDDVVLPPDRRAQLDEMVAHVVHATKVLNTWGLGTQLPYGRGVTALFCGPSGTGKTMAAQAVARALNTENYVVDLSRVMSKYIGESEKNLDAVFDDAERAGAVLVFDEADALFGKRSETKDAHDRYANIEVAYLLQRMEAFAGLAILTTNFRQNLDAAFMRRLRFVVEFPKPDAEAREAIWRLCLGAAPVAEDVTLRFLARRFELMGGNIRQITLRAAFAAAAEKADAIATRHLVTAMRAELSKLGMHSAERELAATTRAA